MYQIEKRKGVGEEPDAFFVCIGHDDTPALIHHLRKNKIKFSVDVDPEPSKDQSDEDIFWFESGSDISRIQEFIYQITKQNKT